MSKTLDGMFAPMFEQLWKWREEFMAHQSGYGYRSDGTALTADSERCAQSVVANAPVTPETSESIQADVIANIRTEVDRLVRAPGLDFRRVDLARRILMAIGG